MTGHKGVQDLLNSETVETLLVPNSHLCFISNFVSFLGRGGETNLPILLEPLVLFCFA